VRILVLGAAGRTGRLVVEQALGHGHDVRAFVRTSEPGFSHPRLEVVHGDVLDFEAVDAAVAGVDAVISAVGSGGGGEVRVYSEGIGNVIHAMTLHGVRCLVVMTAAGVFARSDKNISLGFRAMIATVLKPVYDDMERLEQRVAASDLDWTIVRPVGLSDAEQSGHYRLSLDGSMLRKATRVSRADVAALMLKAAESGAWVRRTLLIAD
jgi:putative NADH-flavin reductase